MSKEAILQLQHISKEYRQGRSTIEILKDVNLTVMPGELVAIIGASGSGKSTLLHIAGLLDKPSGGDVIHNFGEISSLNTKYDLIRLNYIGFVYQNYNLLKDFTARENVILPKLIAGEGYNTSLDEADQLLDELGLSNRVYNMPGELSGGEQQRVAIARSLINKPKLVLADEPTGNLDSSTADEVFNLFIKLARDYNTSVIMVTHNIELAKKMDKIYELKHGALETLL